MNYTEKNKLLDKISIIALFAIFIEVFLYAVHYCYTERIDLILKMPTIMNVFGSIFLIISIVFFIIAYRKSKSNYAVYGVDFLIFAFLCPLITYWYTVSKGFLHTISPKMLWVALLVFYGLRIVYAFIVSYRKANSNSSKKLNKKRVK